MLVNPPEGAKKDFVMEVTNKTRADIKVSNKSYLTLTLTDHVNIVNILPTEFFKLTEFLNSSRWKLEELFCC